MGVGRFVLGPSTPSVSSLPSRPVPTHSGIWAMRTGPWLAVVILASVMDVICGSTAAWSHLQSPP